MIGQRGGRALAALAVSGVLWLAVAPGETQGTAWVERVNPRPRLLFAPGEFERLVSETGGARREAFANLLAHIDDRGTRDWNERDIQLESHALAARVLLDRGDPRGPRIVGYARESLRFFLETHTFENWSDSHQIVTLGGRWIEAVALAHDWLHPRWSPEDREAAERWLAEELDHWVSRNRLVRASPSPFRNDAARGVAALVLAGLTLHDVPAHADTARRALEYARPFYDAMLQAHLYAGLGGGMAEGTFYGNFTAWGQTLVAEALFTGAGLSNAYTRSPFYAARLQYAAHAAWPGYVTNQFRFNVHQPAPVFGDARRGPTGSALYHRAIVLLLGKRFPGRAAARQAYWVVNREETSRPYTREWALFDVLFWSPEVTPEPPTALSYREPSLGQVFARSSWTDDATWMSFNAGPHLDTHQHYDAGNLTIFRGVDLLVDSGSFDAFGTNHWYNYYARTVAHNTITITDPQERWDGIWGGVPDNLAVNDGGQRTAAPLTPAPTLDEYLGNRAAYDHGRIDRYKEGAWGVYIRADLTNAYQNPAYQSTRPNRTRNRAKVTHVGREVLYLRGSDARRDVFVVFDRVISTDPTFRKAVLWHARESFDAPRGRRVDEGEIRYEGADRYDFHTLVSFRQGSRQERGRLFLTALAVDPVIVRQIGRREPANGVDHTTFNVGHRHRHIKDYFVEDPRGITNPNRTTGAFGRPEWPPINPPEQQWLFNDDLVGGWGKTRLEVQPAGARQPDRFLTVLVPSDEGNAAAPSIEAARRVDGGAVGTVIREGARPEVVMIGADAGGADLRRGTIDVPLQGRAADLTVMTLTPGGRYLVRVGEGGGVQRIAVMALANGGIAADEAGVLRLKLDDLPRMPLGAAAGVLPAPAGSTAAVDTGSANAAAFEALGYEAEQPQSAERPHPGLVTVNAESAEQAAGWDARITQMLRRGELRLRETTPDALVEGRTHQRLAQLYKGVPVFGGDLSRQIENRRTISVFGTLYENITLNPVPKLTTAEAAEIFGRLSGGGGLGPARTPELIVLPTDDGRYVLTFRARLATRGDVVMTFIDANTGEPVLSFSDLKRPVF